MFASFGVFEASQDNLASLVRNSHRLGSANGNGARMRLRRSSAFDIIILRHSFLFEREVVEDLPSSSKAALNQPRALTARSCTTLSRTTRLKCPSSRRPAFGMRSMLAIRR